MKYCISSRQDNILLKQADEVMIEYRDRETLPDLAEKAPQALLILQIPKAADMNWIKYKKLLALEDIRMGRFCKSYKIPFYWAYPITSYYELRGIIDLGVHQILLGPPLAFDLEVVSKFKVPIRMVANLCYEGHIPRKDGIQGLYIRPEDVQHYEKYVDSIEFYSETLDKEKTLFTIYKEQQYWPGNLNLLLTNFGFDVDNRAIPEEFAIARMQCRQNCMRNGTCRFCYTAVKFSRTLDKNKKELSKLLN